MLKVELSQEDLNILLRLLDTELKTGGLQSLADVVRIHNLLTSAATATQSPNEQKE